MSRARRVALATTGEVPDLDAEGQQLLAALVARGADAGPAVWDDASIDWAALDLVVVRSTWDYAERVAEFLAWAERVEAVTRLENPVALLRWTTDKRYLQDLDRAGVPVVPSTFVEPGDAPEHALLGTEHVAKPAVSAGSRGALLLGAHEDERSVAHVRALLDAGRSVLVQPYLDAVDEHGETAVVVLDGRVSHAIRKGPLLRRGADVVQGLFAQETVDPREPDEAELDVARRALEVVAARVDAPPLYARVDLLPTSDGPVVLELELAEPSLFLDHVDGAADRMADAVLARLP